MLYLVYKICGLGGFFGGELLLLLLWDLMIKDVWEKEVVVGFEEKLWWLLLLLFKENFWIKKFF